MSKRKFVSLVGLFEAAAAALAVVSVITLFGQLHVYVELFSHFKLQYLVTALLLLIVLTLLRRRRLAFLMAAVAVLNAWFVVPWYFGSDEPVSAGTTIKLLHANVLHDNMDTTALMKQIDDEDPDVIVLQEITPVWLAAMTARHDRYPFSVHEAQGGPFGIGLFSRLPLEDARIVHAPPMELPEVRATLIIGERRVSFLSSHPMPPIGRSGIEGRNAQLAALTNELAITRPPTILLGDLNTSMWAPTYHALEKASGLRNARKGFGLVPTFPVFLPVALIPIDHCLVSEEFSVLDFRAGNRTGSDHYPIVVTIAIR